MPVELVAGCRGKRCSRLCVSLCRIYEMENRPAPPRFPTLPEILAAGRRYREGKK